MLNKLFNTKIFLSVIAGLFILNSTAYAINLSNASYLRVQHAASTEEGRKRLKEALSKLTYETFVNQNIAKQAKKKYKEFLKSTEVKKNKKEEFYNSLEKYNDIAILPIDSLYKNTRILEHIGLGRFYAKPIIYIDTSLKDSERKEVLQHAYDEIAKWDEKRKSLGLDWSQMREYILRRENYEEFREFAINTHREAHRIDRILNVYKAKEKNDLLDVIAMMPFKEENIMLAAGENMSRRKFLSVATRGTIVFGLGVSALDSQGVSSQTIREILNSPVFKKFVDLYSYEIISQIVEVCVKEGLNIDQLPSFLETFPKRSARATYRVLPKVLKGCCQIGMDKAKIFSFLETIAGYFATSSDACKNVLKIIETINQKSLRNVNTLALTELLKDEDFLIRASATLSLGLRQNVGILIESLNDNSRLVRGIATWNLIQSGKLIIARILETYKENLNGLKESLRKTSPNIPTEIVKRAEKITLLDNLETLLKKIGLEEEFLIAKNYKKLVAKYSYKTKKIIAWINSQEELPVVKWVIDAAQKTSKRSKELGYNIKISPHFLYSALIGEGFGVWMDRAYYNSRDKYNLKENMAEMIGLHWWDSGVKKEIAKLKKLGFISNTITINKPVTAPEALEVITGLLTWRGKMFFENATKILGEEMVQSMTSIEKDFWIYAFYNNPSVATAVLKKRKTTPIEKLLSWDKKEHYQPDYVTVRENAIRIISQEESLLMLGVFFQEEMFKEIKKSIDDYIIKMEDQIPRTIKLMEKKRNRTLLDNNI